MSKVKYIIEVDKEDIDIFLTGMNENYIIHQYDGEEAVCGRVLLSAFRTATPIAESDDAVSRQAVLNINENHHGEMPNHINFEIWNEIKALPPVLPKREQGEWIEEKHGYRCNKCNRFYKGEWSIENNAMMPQKYCPNCGAEMR